MATKPDSTRSASRRSPVVYDSGKCSELRQKRQIQQFAALGQDQERNRLELAARFTCMTGSVVQESGSRACRIILSICIRTSMDRSCYEESLCWQFASQRDRDRFAWYFPATR